MEPIKIAVRKVVELALRCGDIDNRNGDSAEAMQAGARAHRKLQKMYDEIYSSEVSLSLNTTIAGVDVILQGRADGVAITPDGVVIIDEIKTTNMPLEHMYAQSEQHMGQVRCYAHMLASTIEDPPDSITVQLTYHQLESGETVRRQWAFTRAELRAFFESLTEKYGVWLKYERDWKLLRDRTIHETGFPFDCYRRGQREFAVAVYRRIERGGRLFAQAPTGIGKTISTIFPAVKAMGEGRADKIFYLTAKTVTRSVAEDAVRRMTDMGLRFKSITLRAKDKICFKAESNCNPDYCEYAKGHYDRVNEALMDMLEHNDIITPEITTRYAETHRVCPHELALDAALWVDLIVGDYNHVFDPTAYLKRFFSDAGNSDRYVFLIDEAHNLVDRVRDMYSAFLRKTDFMAVKRKLKDKNGPASNLRGAVNNLNARMIALRKELNAGFKQALVLEDRDAELDEAAVKFIAATEEWLAAERGTAHELYGEVLELYFSALEFNMIGEMFDERYRRIVEVFGNDVLVTYFCVDPSQVAAECMDRARATILFSATLTPLAYYRNILGGTPYDPMLALPSPFDRDRLLLAAHRGISTKYADRSASLAPITEAVHVATSGKRGNYMVFFPSYEYMRAVHERFTAEYPAVRTVLQRKDMAEDERADFLLMFDRDNTETLLGFCVLGGIFSEGIDLKGERLIGAVIIGVGLPKLSLRQNLIRDFFNVRSGQGYDYAYVFPGMNKVLQAAGRVIRTESDRGVVLLIDSRFATARYRELYPEHWANMRMARNTAEIRTMLDAFAFDPADAEKGGAR